MWIAFGIWSSIAAVFVIISVGCRLSDKPVCFFASTPPKVHDVKMFNRAVSRLWLAGAAVFELTGIPLLFVRQQPWLILLLVLLPVIGLLIMAAVYQHIENQHKL